MITKDGLNEYCRVANSRTWCTSTKIDLLSWKSLTGGRKSWNILTDITSIILVDLFSFSNINISKYFRHWISHLWLSARYLAVYTITRIIASWVLKEVLIRKQRLLLDINQTPCRGEWALEFYTFAARSLLEFILLQLFHYSEKWKSMYSL